jgi:hypothetical protein
MKVEKLTATLVEIVIYFETKHRKLLHLLCEEQEPYGSSEISSDASS